MAENNLHSEKSNSSEVSRASEALANMGTNGAHGSDSSRRGNSSASLKRSTPTNGKALRGERASSGGADRIDASPDGSNGSVWSNNTTAEPPIDPAKRKRKRNAAIITAVACGICVIGLFFMNTGELTFDLDLGLFKGKETEQLVYDGKGQHRLSLYDPDWESDIFQNKEWLEKSRFITYTENGMSIGLVDGDHSPYGRPVEMFGKYVDALMRGDAELVNSFYTADYFESHERFERITMQKLYDIEVEYISRSETTIGGKAVDKYIYRFTYKIMENDGTFRNDLVSDATRSQYYTLIDDGEAVKISDISYIYTEQES